MKHRAVDSRESGFSLVVIAALFVAFSVVVAMAVERNTSTRQVRLHGQATNQIKKLSAAILRYTADNDGHYPCPALYNVLTTDFVTVTTPAIQFSPFGKPANHGTYPLYTPDCDTYTYGASGDGIDLLTGGSADVIRGMVPVAALATYGIDPKDAIDPWGNRIMYVVNRTLTNGVANRTNNPTVTIKSTGFTVGPAPLVPIPVDYLLISYGRDKLGAIPRSSTAPIVACPNNGTNDREENCDKDREFIQAPAYTGATAAAAYFDDILSYYRQQ